MSDAQKSYLEMSDEELMNAPPPSGDMLAQEEPKEDEDPEDQPESQALAAADEGNEAQEEREEEKDEDTDAEADGDDEAGAAQSEESADDDGEKEGEEKEGEDDAEGEVDPELAKKKEKESKDESKKDEPKDDKEQKDTIDYKAEYERLTAPFKANGRELQVKSVDDAIALMQMGANYNKKMAALKPNLKLMKMLENNGLLTEEKISFLIDLDKKNPGAINKLVKDSGLDPMDLDADKASEYKQSTYAVGDQEIELDTVLDELSGSEAYTQTLDIVGNKWDVASKQVIAAQPQLLRVIHDHVASGIYELITAEMENERLFGRLNGLSDIEAYRQVGDAIHARGGFNHLAQGSSRDQGKPAVAGTVVPPKPKKADDAKLKEKRRAASSTKPVAAGSAPTDFNPLALSDEEFSKQVVSKFL